MKRKFLFRVWYIGLLFMVGIFLQYCGGFSPDPVDYSGVPEPYDTTSSGLVHVVLPTDVRYYIVNPGTGSFRLSPLDTEVEVYYTFRARFPDGNLEVFFSSYADENTSALTANINTLAPLTAAMREAFYGMKENEQRTVIVNPENAYANVNERSNYYNYRESDIIIDIEIQKLPYEVP